MDSSTGAAVTTPQPKPLGLLGRDEMNLAEFPIALLADRVPKDQKEAVYQDEIYDERSGLTLSRKLTIQAGTRGLTTALDDEVILCLIQLTKQKNNFTNRKVEFSRHELVQLLGWSMGGASYQRIETSLDRWTSVYLKYENAWRDNRTKTWTSKGFHIIETFELNDTRTSGEQLDLLPSYILWNEVIFESFQAGYLKPLDYDLCMGLSNSTAKRMYRFLDKRFHHKTDWTFDLKELAHEHIGLGRNYDGPAHLKRKMLPAIAELESINFLEPLPEGDRFQKDGKDWKIRLIQKGGIPAALPALTNEAQPEPPALVTELVSRGVTKATAEELAQRHPAESIQLKLDVFDWLLEKQDKRVAQSPAGYLVKSISDDYAAPKGFVPKAERQQREQARQAKERQAAEERRSQKEQEAREKAERQAIEAYWASLTPEQQAELDAVSLAQADAEILAMETGPLKRMGQTIRRHAYIRQLLASREQAPAEG
jgi:Replication initiator protein A